MREVMWTSLYGVSPYFGDIFVELFIVAILFSSNVKIKHYSSDEVRQAKEVVLAAGSGLLLKFMNTLQSQANTTAVSQWEVIWSELLTASCCSIGTNKKA